MTQTPRLRDCPLSATITAHQVYRSVELIIAPERDANPQLNTREQRYLEDFQWRLNDAWKEYDKETK